MNSKGPGNHLIEETRNKDEVCLEGIRECGYHQKGKFTPNSTLLKLTSSTRSRKNATFCKLFTNQTSLWRRDPLQFCEYYKDTGHTTEECVYLKRDIEELIKRGHLTSRWMQGPCQMIPIWTYEDDTPTYKGISVILICPQVFQSTILFSEL